MKVLKHLLAKALITTSAISFIQPAVSVNRSTRLTVVTGPSTNWTNAMLERLSVAKSNALTKRSSQLTAEAAVVDLHGAMHTTPQLRLLAGVGPGSSSDPAWLWMGVLLLSFDCIAKW